MLIDTIYKTVQGLLNKDQLGYLKPMDFNLYLNNAIRKVYNDYLIELKVSVRRSNSHLEGKNMAKYSEYLRQLLEYYSKIQPMTATNGISNLPTDTEFILDVFTMSNIRIDKVPYSVLIDLQRNIYVSPDDCSPKCSKIGEKLEIHPPSISEFKIQYLRRFKNAKWTYVLDNGKPLFEATAQDFEDVDMPETSRDEIISLVFEMAALSIRDIQAAQLANAEQQTDTQESNIQ
jgi:hypothetical protein